MYAKPSSLLDSQAPDVLIANCGFWLGGTKDRSARTAEGHCNRLPISVAMLVKAWQESGSASLERPCDQMSIPPKTGHIMLVMTMVAAGAPTRGL